MGARLRAWFTPQRVANLVVLGLVLFVILREVHPSLLLSSTTVTGGDTGSHIATAWWLYQHLGWHSLTGWYPGWYDGFPVYTYYFVLPDVLAAIAGHIINFNVAFKIATILGSLLLPISAFIMGKLFGAKDPIPAALAGATLPFLFDASYTIAGGNLFSTFAGEYSFSLSLALALVTIGLFARGVRTGRGRWLAAVMLSLTLAAHLLPWFWAIVMIIVVAILEIVTTLGDPGRVNRSWLSRHARRAVWFVVTAGALSAALSAWWLLPYATTQQYTSSMGYVNYPVGSFTSIFTQLGLFNASGGHGGDVVVIPLAFVALFMAWFWRDRLGVVLTLSATLSLIAYVADPQSVIWNERIVPFWFISVYLSAGWLVGRVALQLARRLRPAARRVLDERTDLSAGDRLAAEAQVRSGRTVWATYSVGVAAMLSTVPGLIPATSSLLHLTDNANQATNWASYNYAGYQALPAWHEYHGIITTMEHVARRDGCGRAMWEYNASEGRFGTTEALMLLPYWTNNCVGSMEGLFFEDSATTPYHFLNQSELSAQPDYAMAGLSYDYGSPNVALGVEHLQMLGVRYFMAFSPSIVAAADKDPSLVQVAVTRRWKVSGVRWHVYLVKDSGIVQPLANLPNVLDGLDGRLTWLAANEPWYLDPNRWSVPLASTGPASWPRITSSVYFYKKPAPPTTVSDVRVGSTSVSFHVSRLGTPVEVRISYFPRWHADGAEGPYRVSPNLMVVVPTRHDVRLYYGSTPAVSLGYLITDLALLGLLVALWRVRPWRRTRRISGSRAR